MRRRKGMIALLLTLVMALAVVMPIGVRQVKADGLTSITFKTSLTSDTEYTVTDFNNPYVTVASVDISNIEVQITKVTINSTEYQLAGLYTGDSNTAVDNEGRSALETMNISSNNGTSWALGMQYHGNDDDDDAKDKTNTTVPSFYLPQVTFTSNTYKGVKITGAAKPDMYDDTVYPTAIDITNTSAESPAAAAVYYGAAGFSFSSVYGSSAVSSVELTGTSVPVSAVTISGTQVSFNSGYYSSIPLKVTLADSTSGYIMVTRLGLEIHGTNSVNHVIYHGSQTGVADMTQVSGKTFNIVAVFYYDASTTYSDYDIVANVTYPDGSSETKIVEGFSEVTCVDNSLKGGDYLIWSGDVQSDMPTSVSVTAVKHGAFGASTFGGAMFGAGSGLTATTF